jgi:hypothetical protein
MKHEKEKIDLLIDKNAAEQLGKVDWDRLTDEISARLARAEQGKTSPSGYPTFFKIATGIAATAAVVFVAVALRMHRPSDSQPTEGRSVDKRGTASLEIKRPSGKTLATVRVGRTGKEVAKCDIEIIDRNGDLEKDSDRAAWIIITVPRPTFADNGHSREETDLIHFL